jgi:hypothetical protein
MGVSAEIHISGKRGSAAGRRPKRYYRLSSEVCPLLLHPHREKGRI